MPASGGVCQSLCYAIHLVRFGTQMEILPWGTRGSIPSPGPSTIRYGGNTSCVEVRLRDGTLIIIDAGSGIRPLGAVLGPCDATLLLTHYHWDHIQGLPFFFPAFLPQSSIRIYAPEFDGKPPEEVLADQMIAPYFPAPASQLRGITSFEITTTEPFMVGSATVRAAELCHPGLTYGYRIEDEDAVFVYMSDNEVDMAPPEMLADILDLCSGVDLLLHDSQYTELEYVARKGWGHSTPRQAVRVAKEAGVRQLMVFHHDPTHSDEQVEGLTEDARKQAGDIDVIIGREGEMIKLGQPAEKIYRT